MKIKLLKISRNSYPKLNVVIKKNLELFILIGTVIAVITLVQIFNFVKEQKINHFFDVLNNIYFEKTLNSIIQNLDPKYININHKILSGENFNSILEKYEIPKKEIANIKKNLIRKT